MLNRASSILSATCGGEGLLAFLKATTGEPNAQAQDQIGGQEAIQGHRHRKSHLRPSGQAPRHDQADHEGDPPIARHRRPLQDRRRADQEVFSAQRLNRPGCFIPAYLIEPSGDQPWHASNAASPVTPNTRKSSRPPRVSTAGARTPYASLSRRWRRPTSTPSATASDESARSARSGSSASTPR